MRKFIILLSGFVVLISVGCKDSPTQPAQSDQKDEQVQAKASEDELIKKDNFSQSTNSTSQKVQAALPVDNITIENKNGTFTDFNRIKATSTDAYVNNGFLIIITANGEKNSYNLQEASHININPGSYIRISY